MQYRNELDMKQMLGIETWRDLTKDKFLQFWAAVPEMDRELALQLIHRVPELTTFAKALLDDAAQTYTALIDANGQNMASVHEFDRATLESYRGELAKDLSAEERMRVFHEIRDLHTRVHAKDTENKEFLAAQFDKRLAAGLVFAASVAVLLLGATKSGTKPGSVFRALKVA